MLARLALEIDQRGAIEFALRAGPARRDHRQVVFRAHRDVVSQHRRDRSRTRTLAHRQDRVAAGFLDVSAGLRRFAHRLRVDRQHHVGQPDCSVRQIPGIDLESAGELHVGQMHRIVQRLVLDVAMRSEKRFQAVHVRVVGVRRDAIVPELMSLIGVEVPRARARVDRVGDGVIERAARRKSVGKPRVGRRRRHIPEVILEAAATVQRPVVRAGDSRVFRVARMHRGHGVETHVAQRVAADVLDREALEQHPPVAEPERFRHRALDAETHRGAVVDAVGGQLEVVLDRDPHRAVADHRRALQDPVAVGVRREADRRLDDEIGVRRPVRVQETRFEPDHGAVVADRESPLAREHLVDRRGAHGVTGIPARERGQLVDHEVGITERRELDRPVRVGVDDHRGGCAETTARRTRHSGRRPR